MYMSHNRPLTILSQIKSSFFLSSAMSTMYPVLVIPTQVGVKLICIYPERIQPFKNSFTKYYGLKEFFLLLTNCS